MLRGPTDGVTERGDAAAAEARRRQLAELLRRRAAGGGDLPLSVGQERLHRLARLAPDEPLYNVAVAYRLRGPLSPAAVQRAVTRIAERHDVLRACFPVLDGRPVQRIAGQPPEGLFHSRPVLPGVVAETVAAEARQAFDLASGPLWRVGLFRLGETEHVLTLVMHHLVSDGWSFVLILRELGALTDACARGVPDPLDPPQGQYPAFAERQRAGFAEADHAAQEAYWAQRLSGTIPALDLPADRAGGPALDRTAETVALAWPGGLGEQVMAFARREGVSPFMAALTGFAALLHRWSGQTDLLVCTPVTGRHRAHARGVVGYCNNILPIRLDLAGDPTLRVLLERVRAATLDAHRNQDVPFEAIAAAPALRRIALSRLLFSLDMPWPPELAIEGVACEPLAVETGSADFDLSVSLWPAGAGLAGTLRFKTALFGPDRIAAIGSGFAEALSLLATAPDTPLSAMPAGPIPSRAPPSEAGPPAAAPLGQAAAMAEAPRFPLEERLAQVWRAVFDEKSIGIHDDFRAIGASSLAVALLAERLQESLGVEIDLPALFGAGTIARVAELVEGRDARLANDPLAPIRPHGTKAPLFLFEGVSVYYALTERLDAARPVYGLVRPVVSDLATVEEMAESYVEAILRTRPLGLLHLGGLSFGGIVAFEAAQQLSRRGAEVGLLALFDTPGPNAFRPKGAVGRLIGHAGNMLRFGTPYLRKKVAGRVAGWAGDGTGVAQADAAAPAGLDPDAQRAAFRLFARDYRFAPYAGPIALFQLAERDGMSDTLFDPALGHIDPLLGWGSVGRGDLHPFEVEGDHIGLLREPAVAGLARNLDALLDRYDGAARAAGSPALPEEAPPPRRSARGTGSA